MRYVLTDPFSREVMVYPDGEVSLNEPLGLRNIT